MTGSKVSNSANVAGRSAVLVGGLLVAAASFFHAASENLIPLSWSRGPLPASLEGEVLSKVADRGFRMEIAAQSSQAQAEFPQISDSLADRAREAFAIDPLSVSTIRVLALGGMLQQDEARARSVMQLATQISRRDEIANLWLAQDYGRSEELEAMTASFDHALRTSVRTRETAMKSLVEVLAHERSFRPIGELLELRPEWEQAFWNEFARSPIALPHAADFLEAASLPLDRLMPAQRGSLYRNLRSFGHLDVLLRLAAVDPLASAGFDDLAKGKFVDTSDGNPFGWIFHSRGNSSARVHSATGELQIDARPGAFGLAAARTVQIDRNYELVVEMAEAVPDNVTLELAAVCLGSTSQRLGAVELGTGERSGKVKIADGTCDFANIELSFAVEPGRRDALVRIASIMLRGTG